MTALFNTLCRYPSAQHYASTQGPQRPTPGTIARRAAWLLAQLEQLLGPIWIFMHHNPVAIGIAPMDKIMLLDADRLAAVVAPHRDKIRHIFHGHCHLPLAGSLHGIPLSAPRGTNHAGWPDFGATHLLSSAGLPESYGVILATETGTLVHVVEFGYASKIVGEGAPDDADWDRVTMVR